MANYVLYRKSEQTEISDIITFLDSKKKDFVPKAIFERSFPAQIVRLPAIHDLDSNTCYIGFDRCIEFYETKSKVKDIITKARKFVEKHPEYTLGDSRKEVDDTL